MKTFITIVLILSAIYFWNVYTQMVSTNIDVSIMAERTELDNFRASLK